MDFGSLRLKPFAVSIDLTKFKIYLKFSTFNRDKQKVQQFQNMNNDKNNYALF